MIYVMVIHQERRDMNITTCDGLSELRSYRVLQLLQGCYRVRTGIIKNIKELSNLSNHPSQTIESHRLCQDPRLQTGYSFVPEMSSEERRSALNLCGPHVTEFMVPGWNLEKREIRRDPKKDLGPGALQATPGLLWKEWSWHILADDQTCFFVAEAAFLMFLVVFLDHLHLAQP